MFKKILAALGLTQTQREEIRREVNLFEATEAHIIWKKRLLDFVEGRSSEDLQPHVVGVDNRCVLGKWIHGPGMVRFGEQPFFQQLMEEHAKFHFQAAKVIEAHQAGDAALAHQILSSGFTEQSRKTVNCLTKLNAEIEGNKAGA